MDRRIREFRAAARRRNGRVYPAALRDLAVAYAREATGRGERLWTVSKALGVWVQTLQEWLGASPETFRRVEVVAERGGADAVGLVLRTQGGNEVRGLSVEGAATLLRALEPR